MPREEAKTIINGYRVRDEIRGRWLVPLSDVNDIIDKLDIDHEAQMKTKDEEIKRLKAERDHFHNKYIQVGEHIGEWIKGTKARKIVAMLFWEWKKRKRLYTANGHRSSNAGWGLYEQANLMEVMFKQAYKMLKDNA